MYHDKNFSQKSKAKWGLLGYWNTYEYREIYKRDYSMGCNRSRRLIDQRSQSKKNMWKPQGRLIPLDPEYDILENMCCFVLLKKELGKEKTCNY